MKIDSEKSPETKKNCSTCKWHDKFCWACSNGESQFYAAFTEPKMDCSKWEQDNEYIKVTDVFELIDIVSTNLLITSKYKYFGPDEVRYFLKKLKQEILGYLEEEGDNG